MQTPPLAHSIGLAERAMRALLEPRLRNANLTFSEWTVMALTSALTLNSEQMAWRQIRGYVTADTSEAQGSIDAVISEGLIEISQGSTLAHTPKGAALFASLSSEIKEITHILYGDLPNPDLDATHRTLMAVAERASALLDR